MNIEYCWADYQIERLPALAADLIGRRVAVILVGGSSRVGIRAVMAATQTIPIVFTTGADPVAAGYVVSLNRPAGNVTGVPDFGYRRPVTIQKTSAEAFPHIAGGGRMDF